MEMDGAPSRAEALAGGSLIDYSDAASLLGYRWAVAITDDLESHLHKTLPAALTRPNAGSDEALRVVNNLMNAVVSSVLMHAMRAVHEAGKDPHRANRSSTRFSFEAEWKPNERLDLEISVEADDDGQPCFTVDLA